ncbi:MAG TPA: 4'-phosphopantetheinyl transferase superfamily protein [Dehalococcoidia bacterium]|nr:4'-phosphopantetheinyl transferase superfamily protein [Dehalococcoidia bacterium]
MFPVILPVAQAGHKLSGRERVSRLSRIAREALRLSAEKGGVTLGELRKDQNDVPCPFDGNYWSLAHKPKYVAAVMSKERVGIDIEEIKPRQESIFSLVASDQEWDLGKEESWYTFFRYWTAKEATLKAIGIGIGGLKACRVVSVPDENHIVLDYGGHLYRVEQLYHKNHIVSVLKDNSEVEWAIEEDFSYC